MLTHEELCSLEKMCNDRVKKQKFANPVIHTQLSPGQKLYRFNSSKNGLDVFTFVSFVDALNGGKTAVLARGNSTHPKDYFVKPYFIRDLCFSVGREYIDECYYLDELVAQRRLKKFNTKG